MGGNLYKIFTNIINEEKKSMSNDRIFVAYTS